jgi:hypothetical protein
MPRASGTKLVIAIVVIATIAALLALRYRVFTPSVRDEPPIRAIPY